MKKLLLVALVLALFLYGAITTQAALVNVNWVYDNVANTLQPVQNAWNAVVRGAYFQAASTTATSTFPILEVSSDLLLPNGTVSSPGARFTSDIDTGIYRAGANSLGFAAGGSGAQWNGSAFLPNSTGRTIGADSNPWLSYFVGRGTSNNWRMSTSSLISNTLLFTNNGYPSVNVGADTASAVANFQINGTSQGPYTSFGVINDGGNGLAVFDSTNNIGGLSNNWLFKNSNGPAGFQIPANAGNFNATLRSYNGLGAIFNVLSPYNVFGTEANLSTSIVNSDGTTNTLDVGVQDYGGSFPTGRQMYMHTLASGLTVPMPTWSFGFWQQGYGDTSNSTSSWGWLSASSTGNTLDSTSVVTLGDAWSRGYSKGGGVIDYGPQNVGDYQLGATVQVVASTSRKKALEVFSRNGNTFTSLFTIATTGASTSALTISGLSDGCLNIASGLVGSTGSACGSGGGGLTTWLPGTGYLYTATSTDGALAAYFSATSTTATSTFAGAVNIGSATTAARFSLRNILSQDTLLIEDVASDATPFRIDQSGQVTTGGTVTVGGNVNAYHGGTPGTGLFSFFQGDGSTGAYWGAINSTFQRLGIDGSPIVLNGRPGSTGNVGVGTSTTPTAKLQVTGTGTNNNVFRVSSSSGTAVLDILGDGRVGVGTSTPSTTLQVIGTTTTSGLTLGNITGVLKGTLGAVYAGLVNLATEVTGILGLGNGGTGTSTAPTTDQILVGNTGGSYDYRSITAGSNVTVSTSTPGQIQISATGGGSGTNYLTNSGANSYLNTGSNLQAPTIEATSTNSTSSLPRLSISTMLQVASDWVVGLFGSGLGRDVDNKLAVVNNTDNGFAPSQYQPNRNYTLDSGFSDWYATGTVSHDSTDYFEGTASVKVVAPSGGSFAGMRNNITDVDMSAESFRIWVKSDNWSNVGSASILLSTNGLFTSFYQFDAKSWLVSPENNQWIELHFTKSNLVVGAGTPDLATANDLIFRVTSNSPTATATVWFDGMAMYPNIGAEGGIATIAFDDAIDTQYSIAKPWLDRYGYKATFFNIPEEIGTAGNMTIDQIQQLQKQGHETAMHGATNLGSFSTSSLQAELDKIKAYQIKYGFSDGFSYPNGKYNDLIRAEVRKRFSYARDISFLRNNPSNLDPYSIHAISLSNLTSTSTVFAAIDNAIANNEWVVINFHNLATTTSVDTDYTISGYQQIVDYLNTSGIRVMPFEQVMNMTNERTKSGGYQYIPVPEPSAPASGKLITYVKSIAGRLHLFTKNPNGQSMPVQNAMWNTAVIQWRPTNATAGLWVQTVGAGAGTFANTLPSNSTLYTQQKRARYANVATTTNQVLGQRNTEALWWRGDSAGEGGFYTCADFGFDVWTNGGRAFFGLHSATTVVSADPSALNNTVGFAVDAADNGAISFLTRGTSATKASTGMTITTGKGYKACFYAAPNSSSIGWWIKDINAGTEATGVATTSLPTNTTFLTVGVLASNAALTTVDAIRLGVANIYVEKDY